MTDPDEPRTAIITGASSGIGRAIAIALGGLGWQVAVGARRFDLLEETAAQVAERGGRPWCHPLDVSDPASIDAFVCALDGALGPADVLVNNAGVAFPARVHEMDDATHEHILATNLVGPILLTRRVVGRLLERGRAGDLVFVSSDATVHPRPHLVTYGASKAGLEHFARSLALELEGTGIRSSIVRVGPTFTGFGDGWDLALFEEIIPHWQRFGIQRHFATLDPSDVADAVVRAVTAPPRAWVPIVEVQPRPPLPEP